MNIIYISIIFNLAQPHSFICFIICNYHIRCIHYTVILKLSVLFGYDNCGDFICKVRTHLNIKCSCISYKCFNVGERQVISVNHKRNRIVKIFSYQCSVDQNKIILLDNNQLS